jgi:hypothetical protein
MQLSQFDYLRRSVEALISGAALALQVADGMGRGFRVKVVPQFVS